MNFKRSGKTIFGMTLTPAEQKVLDREIEKQLAERMRQCNIEVEAKVLWSLYNNFDFDEEMLRRFYDDIDMSLDELVKHYEMGDDDLFWLCTRLLKSNGIDIEQWYAESKKKWEETPDGKNRV